MIYVIYTYNDLGQTTHNFPSEHQAINFYNTMVKYGIDCTKGF